MGEVGAGEDVELLDVGLEVLSKALVDDLGGLADVLDLDAGVLGFEGGRGGVGGTLGVVGRPPHNLALFFGRFIELGVAG